MPKAVALRNPSNADVKSVSDTRRFFVKIAPGVEALIDPDAPLECTCAVVARFSDDDDWWPGLVVDKHPQRVKSFRVYMLPIRSIVRGFPRDSVARIVQIHREIK